MRRIVINLRTTIVLAIMAIILFAIFGAGYRHRKK